MSSTDMITVFLLGIALLILIVTTPANALILIGARLVDSTRVNVGAYIHVLERDGDRLFVVEPERALLFNTAGVLYYYFEGGASRRFCPAGEQAIVRIGTADIRLINETGTYNITCTGTGSLGLYEHFKSDSVEWQMPVYNDSNSIIDIINYLIRSGSAQIT
uniref:ORF89 n=1 Tax=Cydia pomonella granulosis virus TaxID=28289 RepID=A0A097P161_GVCP|nr:ORF89 [Cydia pomonella granulovirus]